MWSNQAGQGRITALQAIYAIIGKENFQCTQSW
jgi:hypothetical protein